MIERAAYDCPCYGCQEPIFVGDDVYFDPEFRDYLCLACMRREAEDARVQILYHEPPYDGLDDRI